MAADAADGGGDKDIVAGDVEEALRPVFTRYYNEENRSPAGDVIRGIDWLGNGGFVRNVVEKARDHRNNRVDNEELDLLLAQDELLTEAQLLPFQQLIAEDIAEGVAGAVSDAQDDQIL